MKSFACNCIAENVQEKIKIFCSKPLWIAPLSQNVWEQQDKKISFSVPGITVASFCYSKMSYQKVFILCVIDEQIGKKRTFLSPQIYL